MWNLLRPSGSSEEEGFLEEMRIKRALEGWTDRWGVGRGGNSTAGGKRKIREGREERKAGYLGRNQPGWSGGWTES